MAKDPFIKFFPSDFLSGTSGLNPTERGVYITLLCLIWDNDGPIKDDDGRLARRCGMTKASFRKSLSSLVDDGKIVRTDAGLSNDRAQKTIHDRRNRKQNATHAAHARWSTESGKSEQKQSEDDAGAMQGQCGGNASPESRVQSIGGGDDAGARASPEFVSVSENETRDRGGTNGSASPDLAEREQILTALGADPTSGIVGPNGRMLCTMRDMMAVGRWKEDLGLSFPDILAVITEVMARKRDGPPANLTYFDQAMQRLAGERNRPKLIPIEGDRNDDQPTRGTRPQRPRHHAGGRSPHADFLAAFTGGVPEDD